MDKEDADGRTAVCEAFFLPVVFLLLLLLLLLLGTLLIGSFFTTSIGFGADWGREVFGDDKFEERGCVVSGRGALAGEGLPGGRRERAKRSSLLPFLDIFFLCRNKINNTT